jgi:hypothetical protein
VQCPGGLLCGVFVYIGRPGQRVGWLVGGEGGFELVGQQLSLVVGNLASPGLTQGVQVIRAEPGRPWPAVRPAADLVTYAPAPTAAPGVRSCVRH